MNLDTDFMSITKTYNKMDHKPVCETQKYKSPLEDNIRETYMTLVTLFRYDTKDIIWEIDNW